MSVLHDIIRRFEEEVQDPLKQVERARANGKKSIGCIPYFAPVELVHAAKMHPIELWGGGSLTGTAGSYYPAFYCSLLFTLMERALDGSYDEFSGVIVPTTCDGLRNLEENWKFARPDANIIDFVQPAVRDTREAHGYLVGQLKHVATRLEEISGNKITERSLRESIAIYNLQRQLMRQFSAIAAKHADVITPSVRKAVYAAGRSMPVEEHTALVGELISCLGKEPEYVFPGKKVILTGILVDSPSLLTEFERNDIAVVGDLTVAESARYAIDVPGRIDPFDSLAELWANIEGVSVALDPYKKRGELLSDLARERDADGVVACVVKFCEEEEFDMPVLKQQLDAEHIPFLMLEIESQDVFNEQVATRVQAFKEMLDTF